MHLPPHHAESDLSVLRQFIRENPLGILTTAIPSSSYPLLQSSHIPWILDFDDGGADQDDSTGSGSEAGVLRGHIARQNPQAKAMVESLESAEDDRGDHGGPPRDQGPRRTLQEDVLVLFNGPVQHYITPKFYTETKPASGKVVPTWDYTAVQVYGTARIHFDTHLTETSDFLSQQLADLTRHAETGIMGYRGSGPDGVRPWEVSDAPGRYIDLMKKNIVGIEIEIKSISGRFKLSQEKPKGDRDGVINGLDGLDSAVGAQMADLVRERAALFDAKKEEKKATMRQS